MDFVPSEKATTIRVPATANLQIDSADRNENINPNPFDFQITRDNSLLNGFFTRIGTTEVVLEWDEPNGKKLNSFGDSLVYISSAGAVTSSIVNNYYGPGEYYDASQALRLFADSLSVQFTPANFYVSSIAGQPPVLGVTGLDGFALITNPLTNALGLSSEPSFVATFPTAGIRAPDLRPYRYIDFVSPQLTYNQDLKDSSSAPVVRDVLCRWYFDWDNQPQRDSLGFPIEMGYEPFKVRRLFNPPKQIRWDSRQPVGNLGFQVFGNDELAPIDSDGNSQWLLTAQVSEN